MAMNGILTYWLLTLMMSQVQNFAQVAPVEVAQTPVPTPYQQVSRLHELLFYSFRIDHAQTLPLEKEKKKEKANKITPDKPIVSIIIDDMGNSLALGLKALELPGNLTYSFLPHITHTPQLAELAYSNGNEVMVHMPMQAMRNFKLGPGGLTQGMTKPHLQKQIVKAISAVPHARGLNNHMGSLLTTDVAEMQWVMQTLKPLQFYFVDSRTNAASIAFKTARQQAIPSARRHVFLDHDQNIDVIHKRFQELIAIAKKRGYAVAIGHPHPNTLKYLAANLPRLAEHDIQLVPVSTLISYQVHR